MSADSSAEESVLDRLYEAPPQQFVALRNSLAKELQGTGNGALAAKVRALPKPTVAVWAINQTARREGGRIRQLLEAGDQIRAAQSEAVGGGTFGAEELREASKTERKLVSELVQAAASIVSQPASSSTLQAIEATLHSLAIGTGPERDLLAQGRLGRQATPVSFPEVGAVLPQPTFRPKAEKAAKEKTKSLARSDAQARRRELLKLEAEAKEAKRLAAVEARRASRAADHAAGLDRRARQAEQVASTLRREADAAEREASDARARAAEAHARSREAELKLNRLFPIGDPSGAQNS